MDDRPVRVRFAPSPTGPFHAGSARTVLFNWLFTRHHDGVFILRIEDTDQARYSKDAEADMVAGVEWLGLKWDEGPDVGGDYGPYVQSQRTAIYREHTELLLQRGQAYKCFCTAERLERMRHEQQLRKEPSGYDRFCRSLSPEEVSEKEQAGLSSVIRLKVPSTGRTLVPDKIRGDIEFDNTLLEDIILLKSDGFPTYHLANVVDDHLMRITHVMRGDEWIPSTPLHIIMYDAFGWEHPVFAHLPLILSPTGKGKMSKRKIVDAEGKEYPVMVREFRQAGYLREAMVNFLARLGWSYDDKSEVFSQEELIEKFTLAGVNSSPAAFSYDKLVWMNGVYIRQLDREDLTQRCIPFLQKAGLVSAPCSEEDCDYVARIVPLFQERLHTLSEIVELTEYFFAEEICYPEPTLLIAKKQDATTTLQALQQTRQQLAALDSFDEGRLEESLRGLAAKLEWKAGQLFMPIRVAVTGRKVSPGLFETLAVLGRERTLKRINGAINSLEKLQPA
jgi:glutamyl-tRNA synthetase